MLAREPPFKSVSPLAAMNKIAHAKGPPKLPDCSDELRDFMSKCFSPDPNDRWNVYELLHHSFIVGNSQKRQITSKASLSPNDFKNYKKLQLSSNLKISTTFTPKKSS